MSLVRFGAAPAQLQLTPLALRVESSAFTQGFIDVFSTSAAAPWFSRLHFEGGRVAEGAPALVPTDGDPECLVLQAYVYYRSSMNRWVPNHCGYAYVCRGDVDADGRCTVRFAHKANAKGGGDEVKAPALGEFSFRLSGGGPTAERPFPETPRARALCEALEARATAWYSKPNVPLKEDLKNVHIPQLPCPFSWLPGFAFAAQAPAAAEDERLFERALRVAADRRRWPVEVLLDEDRPTDACVLVAEALAAIPNCMVYNEDCLVDPAHKKAPVPDEAFYADPRTIGNGDCEDMAHEVVNLACSLRKGSWRGALVRRAQALLGRYVVAEMFAGVFMAGSKDVERYKVDPNSKLFAHAFVMFLPATWVQGALERGGGAARLSGRFHAAPTLVQDGITLFAAQPLEPFLAVRSGLASSDEARVEGISQIGANYYKLLSSCMLVDGSVVSIAHGTPVYELGFSTGRRYGAEFVEVVRQSEQVAMFPTCDLTRSEDAFVRRCVAYMHPITPYDVRAPEPSLQLLETTLGATRLPEGPPPPSGGHEFFIQGSDALDPDYLRALRERMPARTGRVQYRLDFFAEGAFSVHVYMR
jgi:hypothetical protein